MDRWSIKGHPLYGLALRRLGLTNAEDASSAPELPRSGLAETVQLAAYEKVKFPESDIRYSTLLQECKRVIALVKDNPNMYKRFMVGLSTIRASANDHQDGEFNHDMAVVKPPKRKRGRNRHDDNKSTLAARSSKKTARSSSSKRKKGCTLCRENGEEGFGHRRGSRCPYYQQWLSQHNPQI